MLAQCDRLGCVREARHRPVIQVSPDGIHYGEAALPIGLCGQHKEQTGLADLITDEGWSLVRLQTLQAGCAPPERQYTKLEWVLLESPPETAL